MRKTTRRAQHARRMAAATAGRQHKPQRQVGSVLCRVQAHLTAAATRCLSHEQHGYL